MPGSSSGHDGGIKTFSGRTRGPINHITNGNMERPQVSPRAAGGGGRAPGHRPQATAKHQRGMASQLFNDLSDSQSARAAGSHQLLSDELCLAALEAAGADSATVLTAAEREHLQTQGYLHLGQLLTPEQCEEAKRRIHTQIAVEVDGVPFSAGSDGDNLRLSNLFNSCNDDGLFDVTLMNSVLKTRNSVSKTRNSVSNTMAFAGCCHAPAALGGDAPHARRRIQVNFHFASLCRELYGPRTIWA